MKKVHKSSWQPTYQINVPYPKTRLWLLYLKYLSHAAENIHKFWTDTKLLTWRYRSKCFWPWYVLTMYNKW
jgi:hypothetical protein